MDLRSLRALALGLNFSAHGVDATVTPPNEAPVTTRVIWVTPLTEALPGQSDFSRRDQIRVLAVRRDEMPAVPRGTVIVAPEPGATVDDVWRVDGMERVETDHHRVVVVRESDFDVRRR